MSYQMQVAIRCEEKAYDLFGAIIRNAEEIIPYDTVRNDDGTFTIFYDWTNYFDLSEDGKCIHLLARCIDELNAYTNLDGYKYCITELGEDDATTYIGNKLLGLPIDYRENERSLIHYKNY